MKGRTALSSVLILVSTFLVSPTASAAQVTTNLLVDINAENPASYSGSGSVLNDVVAPASNATMQNGATYVQGIESGISLDGVTQYLTIPDSAELRIASGNQLTYLIWAKIESFTTYDSLFGKQMASGGWDGFDLSLVTGNAVRLFFNGGAAQETTSATNRFSLNTWTLFTAVLRFNGGASYPSRIYVNGTQVATMANTDATVGVTTAQITVGAKYTSGGNSPKMTVGAFAIYGRELTAAEVQTSYEYYSNYFNDVSSISLASSANVKKGSTATITATVGARGKVRFFSNGKRIAGCLNVPVQFTSLPLTATCTWKPTTTGLLNLSARLYPSSGGVSEAVSTILVQTQRRSSIR